MNTFHFQGDRLHWPAAAGTAVTLFDIGDASCSPCPLWVDFLE